MCLMKGSILPRALPGPHGTRVHRDGEEAFTDIPWHVGRPKRNFLPRARALAMQGVNIFYPNRHPDTLVSFFVSVLLKRGGIGSPAASPLGVLT